MRRLALRTSELHYGPPFFSHQEGIELRQPFGSKTKKRVGETFLGGPTREC